MKLILTHPNADFDAAAATLAASKLYPDAIPVLPERLNRNVRHFMMLYRNGLNFVHESDLDARNVKQVVLVDTQRLPTIKGVKANTPQIIIDHHQPHYTAPNAVSEPVGAATTLLIERIQQEHIPINSLEATLLALGIYEDTGSLAYGTTTPRDIQAAAWLLEQNADLDTVRRFLTPPLTDEQQALFDQLLVSTESRAIHGHTITVGAVKIDHEVEQISSVAHRLRDMLEASALFIAVQMPEKLLLVCRATDDTLDVGAIARQLGGGGHERAAAATIYDKSLDEVLETLWSLVHTHIRPMVKVADLMSYGVQTVRPDQQVGEVVGQLRRIGHEGFPVVEGGRVVGLLTRREVDRAIEHGLNHLTIREIMTSGEVTLRPQDSALMLEQVMVESGWGQIPVLDDEDRLIGIITRTDLITHWAHAHPTTPAADARLTLEQITGVLGASAARLIDTVSQQAQEMNLSLYLVGGVVRDLLLKRRNLDIDFVVENQAIDLVKSLSSRYGGEIHSFHPFGTAKWVLDEQVAQRLEADDAAFPPHLDFATARNEFYETPTALPTIYRSSIKLDLQRRDFTINALAVRLSPRSTAGRILDFYGGQDDLQKGLIRVLHSLSFVDDPTRILRAVRFQHRLKFTIEPRTAELIDTALPMLRRITGERVRNELDLLLREDHPEQALLILQARGVLQAIHPAFKLPADITRDFEAVRRPQPPWKLSEPPTTADLYWHVIASAIPVETLPDLCERLLFGRRKAQALLHSARLVQHDVLRHPEMRPSQVVDALESAPETALLAAWLLVNEPLVRERIERYMQEWRHIQPTTTGHTLRAMGLPPGPCYSVILNRLRDARLDGQADSGDDEQHLLKQWVEVEGICDDDSG